jgi:uncharacterized protein (TIGR02266 family)
MFRELGTVFLSRYGRVRTASRGVEALSIARRERPDVAVVDLHLPDLDGASVCRALREDPATRDMVVVLVGGRSAEDHARAIRAGASDVLTKPLSRVTLVESVGRFVGTDNPRGLPRVELEEPLSVRVGGTRRGRVRNLSRGGVFIETDWSPSAGEEIAVEFELPEGLAAVSSTARLVWQREGNDLPEGIGMRFVALDRETARNLDAFVHERYVPPTGPSAAVGGSAR